MTSAIAGIEDSILALADAWQRAVGVAGGADAQSDVDAMTDAGILAVNDALSGLRRQVDGLHARVAAGISHRSRAELGKEGLARKTGHRTPTKLIATATGGHAGDAVRLIHVGEATQQRSTLSGERAPAKHPHVGAALATGLLSIAGAAAISAMLDRIAVRIGAARAGEAERALVEQAPTLTLDELGAVLRRAEAHLDPDGLEPVIEELHAERSLRFSYDAAGMLIMLGKFDPESGAPIKAAIEAIVTQQLRVSRGANRPGGAVGSAGPTGAGASADGAAGHADRSSGAAGTVPDGASDSPDGSVSASARPVADENRSIPQMQADALAALCRHAIGCDDSVVPDTSATVIVRVDLETLRAGIGVAEIDGVEQPIDAGTARRLASAANLIPCVLGTDSEILDWGRKKRHFTGAQRRALAERDGGCAFCHLPPSMTEAHHIRWWMRDAGPTDLRNAILLCTACHHRVHADGWEVRIDPPPSGDPTGGTVFFIPPPQIDPSRTPRLGGRKRFDPLWRLAA